MGKTKQAADQKKCKITTEESCMLRTLHQVGKIKISDIIKDTKKYPAFKKFSTATIYRHAKKPLDGSQPLDRRHSNPGRPKKLSDGDLRLIRRSILHLRNESGTFTSGELQESCGLTKQISNSGFRKYLHKAGYRCRRTRKKGMLTYGDLVKRLRFVKKVRKNFKTGSAPLWQKGISMYVDGVGFEYKRNPFLHAKAPQAREWRLPNEGLKFGCTSKGKKEGTTQVQFLVGISYNAGVVLCEPLTRRMNGHYYSILIKRNFPAAFKKSCNPRAKRVLVDGDPSQNSKKAKDAFARLGAKRFTIPPRSPDLNPIENVFHLVRRKLRKQAKKKNITSESKEEFTERAKTLLENFSKDKINKTIESMPRRIEMIRKRRGQRIKY